MLIFMRRRGLDLDIQRGSSPQHSKSMHFVTFIAFQFYRYFSNRSGLVPYFSALLAITLFVYVHFLVLVVLLDQLSLIAFSKTDTKGEKWTIMFLALLPLYLIAFSLIRRSDLERLKETFTDDRQSNRANTRLLIYTLFLFLLLFITAIV